MNKKDSSALARSKNSAGHMRNLTTKSDHNDAEPSHPIGDMLCLLWGAWQTQPSRPLTSQLGAADATAAFAYVHGWQFAAPHERLELAEADAKLLSSLAVGQQCRAV